jgi:hypothetical protein
VRVDDDRAAMDLECSLPESLVTRLRESGHDERQDKQAQNNDLEKFHMFTCNL